MIKRCAPNFPEKKSKKQSSASILKGLGTAVPITDGVAIEVDSVVHGPVASDTFPATVPIANLDIEDQSSDTLVCDLSVAPTGGESASAELVSVARGCDVSYTFPTAVPIANDDAVLQARGTPHTHIVMHSLDAPDFRQSEAPSGGGSASAAAPVSNESSLVASPGNNRARFIANCQPLRVCCNLSQVGVVAVGMRFSFEAVVFVVYPASTQPDRRHVLLVDSTGCAGLTVWGAHVPQFTFATVGCVVKFTKLGMVVHNGKKSLSMGKDTIVQFVPNSVETPASMWWNALASKKVLRIMDVHDCEDDSIVNVAGIVGMLSSETKRVRADNKDLMTMRLTDHTGHLDVRSWNHSETEFRSFLEKPLLLQRIRVTSYAGFKICELLDGNGTIVVSNFEGQDELQKYWAE